MALPIGVVVCASLAARGGATGAAHSAAAAEALQGPVSWLWILVAFLLGLIGSAHFTILNSTLFSLNSEDFDDLKRERPRSASLLRRQRAQLDRTWFTLLIGSVVFNLVFAMAVGGALVNLAGGGLLRSANAGPSAGLGWLAVLLVVATLGVWLLGEMLPGLLAARFLKALAPWAARWIRLWTPVLAPLTFLPLALLRLVGRLRSADAGATYANLAAERRLLTLIGVGKVDVSLEEEEREMIDHALGFGENTVGDIMTPRSDIICFEVGSSQEEALDTMRHTPRSRVLVYKKSLDEVVGILHTKQILLNPETDYAQLIRPALFVEESTDLIELLALMRAERSQLAVVLDAYGATVGVVSFDDLLQALVGQGIEGESGAGGSTPLDAEASRCC